LLELAPDTVSFDAWQGLESVCNDPLALDLLGEVETIAWGIIPTSEDDLNSLDVPALAERWRTAVSVLGDPDAMLERSVFTPACGLGSRTLAVATLAFSTLTRFAAHPSLRAR
jgi:hypothetical protein